MDGRSLAFGGGDAGTAGPERPAGNGPVGRRRRRQCPRRHDELKISGPCFCKMLVPNHIAGAIIGRQGSTIAYMEMLTRCQLQISSEQRFFPGTNDRILIMGGTMQSLEDCITLVLKRLQEFAGNRDKPLTLKLVVPNSSVSALIGHGGHMARQLSNSTDCRMNISSRVGDLKERLVSLCGSSKNVARATMQVCRELQADPHFAEHLCLRYDVEIPLGAWAGAKAGPSDPSAPLLSPAGAAGRTKREVIEHLRKTAPREILIRHGLLGNINNTVKSKSSDQLIGVVSETWLARGGDLALAPPGRVLEDDGVFSDQESVASASWYSVPRELVLTMHDADRVRAMALAPPPASEDSDPVAGPALVLTLHDADLIRARAERLALDSISEPDPVELALALHDADRIKAKAKLAPPASGDSGSTPSSGELVLTLHDTDLIRARAGGSALPPVRGDSDSAPSVGSCSYAGTMFCDDDGEESETDEARAWPEPPLPRVGTAASSVGTQRPPACDQAAGAAADQPQPARNCAARRSPSSNSPEAASSKCSSPGCGAKGPAGHDGAAAGAVAEQRWRGLLIGPDAARLLPSSSTAESSGSEGGHGEGEGSLALRIGGLSGALLIGPLAASLDLLGSGWLPFSFSAFSRWSASCSPPASRSAA